jgi:hypothetical protein
VLGQVAGLPGAPVRVQLGAATPQAISNNITIPGPTLSGSPPVLYLSPYLLMWAGPGTSFTQGLGPDAAVTIIHRMIYGGQRVGDPAQQAIAAAVLIAAGLPLSGRQYGGPLVAAPPGSPALAAAHRFAALPASVRHAWLTAHLAALRAGRVTLEELP